MSKTKDFLISFIGLKLGIHHFEYRINNSFFENFDYHEFNNSNIKVNVVLNKKTNFFELDFKHNGIVSIPCDVTNEEFNLEINGCFKLIVRFGETYNNDNEELLILPYSEFQIDIIHYIYETIVLSVPLKRVSPVAKNKSLDEKKLNTLNKNLEIQNDTKKYNDPRWDKLKQLITDK